MSLSGSGTATIGGSTLYQLKGSIGLSAPGSNFGSASFISHRSLINNYPLTGMQADIAVNIPDLAAGTVHASIFSTANFSFNTYLQTHSKLGSALGGASARVAFRHRSTDSFSFSVAVSNVMTMPGSITLSGDISSTGGYSTDFFLCIAYYSLNASVRARVKGGGSTPFSMAVRGAANAKGRLRFAGRRNRRQRQLQVHGAGNLLAVGLVVFRLRRVHVESDRVLRLISRRGTRRTTHLLARPHDRARSPRWRCVL